jgi:6-pyruvoyltetrahydropterin/6-carboxytetrahydropterin synthase
LESPDCHYLQQLDEIGMALDYGIIKKALAEVLESLDHQYLNDLEALNGMNPTSENLPAYLYGAFQADHQARLQGGRSRDF